MNEFVKTGVALGAAAALAALAYSMKPGEVRLEQFSDEGEVFFPQFTDGEEIAELEVMAFRKETSDVYPFVVKRDDKGVWRIPSHYNYPADANAQMGKAAAMLIGLRKEAIVGDEIALHKECGVVDPMAPGAETEGRGKRVKLRDSAGNVLADLIVGHEVEGKDGMFYVRVPEKKRVYKCHLEGKLSTQFADWIETDLLQAKSWNINKVVFDNYSIDEVKRQIVPGEKLVLEKGSDGKWQLDGLDPEKEEVDTSKVSEITNSLSQIKIVGVRSKPEGLTARLERANGIEATLLQSALQRKGYFLGRGGKLYSNEGDLIFETTSGVRYTLRFGELVPGEGDEVTAGIGKEEPKEGEEEPAVDDANNRYLMVTAEFVEELLDKPTGVRLEQEELDKRKTAREMIESIQAAVESYRSGHDGKLPESLAVLAEKPDEGDPLLESVPQDPWGNDYQLTGEGDTYVVLSFGADGKEGGEGAAHDVRSDQLPFEDELVKSAAAWDSYDKKVETGTEEADKLTKRFGPWYYVIDKTLFDKLKPQRSDLVKPKESDEEKDKK